MNLKGLFNSHLLLPLITALLTACMAVVSKKNAFLSNKKLMIFILISSLVIALPSLLSLLGILFIPHFYLISQVVFLGIGYFYMNEVSGFFSGENEGLNRLMIILCTIAILCLGSYLFSLFFNFASEYKYGLIASTCTYTIFIPILIKWVFISLVNIPSEIYKIWKYRTNYNEPDFTSETAEKIMVLELELTKKTTDNEVVKVRVKAPTDFNFGDWFQLFLIDYNSKYFEHPIIFQNDNGEMYNWIFYIKPSLSSGKKYIDYEKNIAANNLTEKTTIICKRVDKTFIN